MNQERFEKQLAFLLEIDKEKNILRQTHLSNHGRREDDAEHAWHMAMMAYILQEYSNQKIDIGHTMLLCLMHDLVEIYAGDTYAYDAEGKKSQKLREEKAKDRLFSLLPDDQKDEMCRLFEEFEACETPEAKFARAMDNFQPFLLNDSNDGGDWKAHHVSYDQVMARQSGSEPGSEELYAYTKEKVQEHVKKGNLLPPKD